MINKTARHLKNQSGSAFFYIILAVALFGVLAFTISRSMKGKRVDSLNRHEISVAVSEILDSAQKLERAVNKLRQKNVSESDLCFTHNLHDATNNAAYANIATCADNTYKLYHSTGGNAVFRSIPQEWLDASKSAAQGYGEWMFTNVTAVTGLGAGALNVATSVELIAHVSHLKENLCEAINKKLGITGIPDNGTAFSLTAPVNSGFTTATGQINQASFSGRRSGCFLHSSGSPSYVFYHVLLERD